MKAPLAFSMLLACALVFPVQASSHSAGEEDEVVVYVIPHSHWYVAHVSSSNVHTATSRLRRTNVLEKAERAVDVI